MLKSDLIDRVSAVHGTISAKSPQKTIKTKSDKSSEDVKGSLLICYYERSAAKCDHEY